MTEKKSNLSGPLATLAHEKCSLSITRSTPSPAVLLVGLLVVLLTACNPTTGYQQHGSMPVVETTISADGEMIAALDRPPPHRQPRLRIKRLLPRESAWQEVPISPHISSVRFGLTGKQLLLTEVIDKTKLAVLVTWDMERLDAPPTLLYTGYRLDFPIEFKPDHYLVRSCNNERESWPCTDRVFNWKWEWVHDKRPMQVFDRKDAHEPLLYGQPTVVGERGFFWFTDFRRRRFITLSFKGQKLDAPEIPFDDATTNVECDQALQRCLRRFQQGLTAERKFIYAFSVFYAGQSCEVPGLAGFGDAFSLTPDGRAAVTAWAEGAELPRRVVVMRFRPGQCAPVSIQPHPFEEPQS